MNIHVTGTGHGNKGAELMLAAIVDRLHRDLPGARLVADPTLGPYAWRARYGLYQLMDIRRAGRLGPLIELLMHEGYRRRFGLVTEREIGAVLDASGFAFGDAWKPEWIEAAADRLEYGRRLGRKIVLLPQAFGPFTLPRASAASRRALESADLVYARDEDSLRYVSELVPGLPSLRLAPDFTNLLPGALPPDLKLPERAVAVVPNAQMRFHGGPDAGAHYVPFLTTLIETIRKRDHTPFLLLHEASADRPLAKELLDACGGNMLVIEEDDPVRLKGIIGACRWVVASRFHALVSALSQGVPALGTAWSHKYLALFRDYGCPDLLLDPASDASSWEPLVSTFCQDEELDASRRLLTSRAEEHRAAADSMWRDVLSLLRGDAA